MTRERNSLRGLLACLALLGAIAVLATTPAAALAQPSSGCAQPAAAKRFFLTSQVDGVQRSALVNVPAAYPATAPLPLMLVFHGAGSTGAGTEASIGMSDVGARAGFIGVYPNANGNYWMLNGSDDDVTFVRSLLDQVEASVCVDDSRVYAVGGSYGGGFVQRIACEMSDRLTAVASVAGLYGVEPPCQPSRPLSVLEIHGTADTTVPFNGGGPLHAASVASFVTGWEQLDACPPASATQWRLTRKIYLTQVVGCAAGTTVAAVKLVGEPHTWPAGRTSAGVPFSASEAIWDFFSTGSVHAQPGAAGARRHRHHH